jgi:glycosyltransferase involved in cell wall biosynthesis
MSEGRGGIGYGSALKIAHVITRLIVGGAQENTLLSCEGQHASGHEVTLLTGPEEGPEGSLMTRANAAGFGVETVDPMCRSVNPLRDWQAFHALRHYFEKSRPDVVHTHSSKAGILGRLAAWKAGVPHVVHTIHGLSFTASERAVVNAAYVRLEKLAARRCHTILSVANAMTRVSLNRGVGRPGQYATVYSGMNVSAFVKPARDRDAVRRELGLKADDLAVVTVARLFHMKGHEDLLDHAKPLCGRHPNLKFLWIGDGLLRPDFERRIGEMNLRDRFILVGLVPPDRVPELVNAADVLAHPSRREGLARALPQGQLAGLPVVTYDIDGNADGLIHDQTGYALPPFDVDAFIDKLDTLLADRSLRHRMGIAGRSFARERFGADTMVRHLERIYTRDLTRPASEA